MTDKKTTPLTEPYYMEVSHLGQEGIGEIGVKLKPSYPHHRERTRFHDITITMHLPEDTEKDWRIGKQIKVIFMVAE